MLRGYAKRLTMGLLGVAIVAGAGCGGVGLPPFTLTNARPFNVGSHTTDMAADTHEGLLAYFAPGIDRLYDMLGTRFDWNAAAPAEKYEVAIDRPACRPVVIRRQAP